MSTLLAHSHAGFAMTAPTHANTCSAISVADADPPARCLVTAMLGWSKYHAFR